MTKTDSCSLPLGAVSLLNYCINQRLFSVFYVRSSVPLFPNFPGKKKILPLHSTPAVLSKYRVQFYKRKNHVHVSNVDMLLK